MSGAGARCRGAECSAPGLVPHGRSSGYAPECSQPCGTQHSHIILEPGEGRRRPGPYANIPVPVLQVPAVEDEGPVGLPSLLKDKEKVDYEKEKKEDDDYEEEMDGMRRDKEEIQDSLSVEEGMMVKFPFVLFATFLCPPSPAASDSRFVPPRRSKKEEIKTFYPNQLKLWKHIVCKGCGKKCKTNKSINRHKKLVFDKPQEELLKFLNVGKEEDGTGQP